MRLLRKQTKGGRVDYVAYLNELKKVKAVDARTPDGVPIEVRRLMKERAASVTPPASRGSTPGSFAIRSDIRKASHASVRDFKDETEVPHDHVHGRKHDGEEGHSLPLTHPDEEADATLQKEGRQIAEKVHTKYTRMQQAFHALDADKSGALSKLEFMEAVKNFNLHIPFEHMMQIIDDCDTNKDGQISYVEFAEQMRRFEGGEVGILRNLGSGGL